MGILNLFRKNKVSVAEVRERLNMEKEIQQRVTARLITELEKANSIKYERGFIDPMFENREDRFRPASTEDFLELFEGYHNTFSCVDAICRNAANVPQKLYKLKRTSEETDEDEKEVTDGEVWELLFNPNPNEDNYNFRYSLMAYLCLTGNSYVEKGGGSAMLPEQLWTLRPDWMKIRADSKGSITGYDYEVDGQVNHYDPDRIIGFKLFHPRSFLYGMSPLSPSQNSIIIDLYCIKYAKQFFKQGGHINWYVSVKEALDSKDFERLDQQLQTYFGGLEKAHKPRVLDNGSELKEVGGDPDKVALVPQRKQSLDEACQIWGVPAFVLGLPNETHYNNADAQLKAFLEQTIQPKNRIVDFILNRKLLYPLGYEVRSDYSGYDVLQPNLKDKAMTGKFLIDSRQWTPNEVRQELWNKKGYEGGDTFPERGNSFDFTMSKGKQPVTLEQVVKLISMVTDRKNNGPIIINTEKGTKQIEDCRGNEDRKRKYEEIKKASVSSIEALRKFIYPHYEKVSKEIYKNLMNNVIGSLNTVKKSIMIIKDDMIKRVLSNMDDETIQMTRDLLKVKREVLNESIRREYKRIKNKPIPEDELKEIKDKLDSRLIKLAEDASDNITETAKERVKGHLEKALDQNQNVGEMTKNIQALFEGTAKGDFPWSRTIARTETIKFSNFSRFETINQLGYAKKQWHHSGHDDARDSHLKADGEIRKMDEDFSMGLKFPGDPAGGADEVVNCGCTFSEFVEGVVEE